MAVEDVRVTFYTISRCGFYPWGMENPIFGGINDTFNQLEKWGSNSELSLTKLLDPAPDDDELPVYLLGIQPSDTDYVFALWNEVPSADGAFTSVSMNSIVGAPQLHLNALTAGTIPGYATYFWVVPDQGVIASIRPMGNTSGLKAMEGYVKKFLMLKSKYAIDGKNEKDEYTVVGHTNKGDKVPLNAHPRFHTTTYKKRGRRPYLLENHARISKVIRVGHVTLDKTVDRGILQSFVQFVRGDANQANHITGVRKAKVELEYTPTEAELIAMMEADDADQDGTRWEDLGFELAGDANKIIWINKSRASDTFSLEVTRQGGDIISLQSLADSLKDSRNHLLKLLEDV
jgi:hypothetical protein